MNSASIRFLSCLISITVFSNCATVLAGIAASRAFWEGHRYHEQIQGLLRRGRRHPDGPQQPHSPAGVRVSWTVAMAEPDRCMKTRSLKSNQTVATWQQGAWHSGQVWLHRQSSIGKNVSRQACKSRAVFLTDSSEAWCRVQRCPIARLALPQVAVEAHGMAGLEG